MPSRLVFRWFVAAVLPLCAAVGCSASGSSAADGGPQGDGGAASGCNRANFVYLDGQAQSIWVSGSFTQPGPWAKDLGSGALALTPMGQGAWLLQPTVAAADHTLYKFIIDGGAKWNFDYFNPVSEPDGQGGTNSVLGTRQTFIFSAPQASSMLVTGSFTTPAAWAATEASGAVALKKSGIGDYWVTNTNLPVGRNLYKFIVDGGNAWVPDPLNPNREADGTGLGYNSVLTVCRDH